MEGLGTVRHAHTDTAHERSEGGAPAGGGDGRTDVGPGKDGSDMVMPRGPTVGLRGSHQVRWWGEEGGGEGDRAGREGRMLQGQGPTDRPRPIQYAGPG